MVTILSEWKLYVYSGLGPPKFKGVSYSSANALKSKIEELFPEKITASYVSAQKLSEIFNDDHSNNTEWPRKVVIVFPGGECSIWDKQLKGTIEKIRDFVEKGGNLLMVCAGAYFSAEKSTYSAPGELLEGSRGLNFFPGTASGPKRVSIDDRDPHKKGITVTTYYKETGKTGFVYKKGGGEFTPNQDAVEESDYEVLYRYKDKTIAAARSKIGKGKVVMSFLHFEYDPIPEERFSYFSQKEYNLLRKLNKELQESLSFRNHFFVECFDYFMDRTIRHHHQ